MKIVLSIIPCPVAVSTGVASRGDKQEMNESIDDIARKLRNTVFHNTPFKPSSRSPYRWFGPEDGKMIWYCAITRNPGFRDFACNCQDIKRCVAAEESGEIHEARVVIVSADSNGNFRRIEERKARELYAKILDEVQAMSTSGSRPQVKQSPRGPIFILTPAFLGISDDDEPW